MDVYSPCCIFEGVSPPLVTRGGFAAHVASDYDASTTGLYAKAAKSSWQAGFQNRRWRISGCDASHCCSDGLVRLSGRFIAERGYLLATLIGGSSYTARNKC